jgi:hypothetical protein
MFSGSYDPADVTFLLKPVALAYTPVAEKERLIQSGRRHYSEMISPERPPSDRYLAAFHAAFDANLERFAGDVLRLAALLADRRPGPLTLVSLARAGTPVGVLLRRALAAHFGRPAAHYSVSIIRDRGLDETALRHVLSRHPAASVVFVDGWTGKGVIASELSKATASFNARTGARLDAGLAAVADLSGSAAVAATGDDYLIPSCLLGATVSGLVSRSILNREVVGSDDFHACLHLTDLAPYDLSRAFVDRVTDAMARQVAADGIPAPTLMPAGWRERQRGVNAAFVRGLGERFGVADVNRLKPGLGEATRVLLRRVPDLLLVRDRADAAAAPLVELAGEKGVPVVVDGAMPYRAAAVIRDVGEA